MDVVVARTFLEIVQTGSFFAAAERLLVTQSAVSLRVKKLEEALGRSLFVRSKAGVALTAAGRQFERHARAMINIWEDAQFQIKVPEGTIDTVMIGCQNAIWPRVGADWLTMMEFRMPEVAIHIRLGQPEQLMHQLHLGHVDIAILYRPELRPGLRVRQIMADRLLLVASHPDYPPDLDHRYVYVDWGPEFAVAHRLQHQDFRGSRVTASIGADALMLVLNRARGGYRPECVVPRPLESGVVHRGKGVPAEPFPAYVAWEDGELSDALEESLLCLEVVATEMLN